MSGLVQLGRRIQHTWQATVHRHRNIAAVLYRHVCAGDKLREHCARLIPGSSDGQRVLASLGADVGDDRDDLTVVAALAHRQVVVVLVDGVVLLILV